MEIIVLSDFSVDLNRDEKRWNILWHGSGTEEVPNSVTTIRFATIFFLNVSVCMNRHWYVTSPSLIWNLEVWWQFYMVEFWKQFFNYLWTNAELSNKCLNLVIVPTKRTNKWWSFLFKSCQKIRNLRVLIEKIRLLDLYIFFKSINMWK